MLVQKSSAQLYNEYVAAMQRIADIKYAAAVLQWDQETYLPVKGAAARARQLATLSEAAHKMSTAAPMGKLLNNLSAAGDLDDKQRKNVALTLEEYNKQKKFKASFVRQMSETISAAFHSWIEARNSNDYFVFEPVLAGLIDLKKKEANILGFEHHPYNALLNEYEKGMNVSQLNKLFDDMTVPLQQLIQRKVNQQKIDRSFLFQHYPKQEQWNWGMFLLKEGGYDFEAGRQDISTHPFSTNFSAKDVRITTRIDENDFTNMTWSTLHEMGHALYEQGLPDEEYGLPSGEYISLSIHESQSRLWENCVGRSREYWHHYYPVLKERFPQQLNNISEGDFYESINYVQPSLIRTEADELTYHFHVKIRYQMEKEIICGELKTVDIKERWNNLYKENLQIDVPDDKRGCLQDVHWSHGSFGYFPTYSLGSFYAAQFWQAAQQQIPDLINKISNGNTMPLLQWLRINIHNKGKLLNSEELCKSVTGNVLETSAFLSYIDVKQRNA